MRQLRPAVIALLLSAVCGCAAPQYDDQTDKLMTQLQTDVDSQIVALISLDQQIARLSKATDAASGKALAAAKTKAGYDANTGFYDKVDVDLLLLQTRVDAEPSGATPHLDSAIGALRANLLSGKGSMQDTHRQVDVLSESYLVIVEQIVDAQIGALLTRELGLKAGASAASPSTQAPTPPAAPKPAVTTGGAT